MKHKLSEDEYRILLVDLPLKVRAMVSFDTDDFPTVIVNSRLSYRMQRRAVRHEIDHIEHDDIYAADIRSIEDRASLA